MNIAYKLFRIKKGKLYPLYVFANEELPVGIYLEAKEGPRTERGKVKSKLGELAFRPGWHLTSLPLANHIGTRQPNGLLYQAKDTVWCEVAYDNDIDYTDLAKAKSHIQRDQCLKEIPKKGFYWYTTNASATVPWLISGGIIIRRILTNEEVAFICRKNGFEPQPISPR